MKKIHILLIVITTILLYSCEKNEIETVTANKPAAIDRTPNPDPNDDPMYYDNDPDCDQNTQSGNCCDTDGRILVVPGHSYTYTYDGFRAPSSGNTVLTNIEWKVKSGSITLISGQNTAEATFIFETDFTGGEITAIGLVDGSGCQSTLTISKL